MLDSLRGGIHEFEFVLHVSEVIFLLDLLGHFQLRGLRVEVIQVLLQEHQFLGSVFDDLDREVEFKEVDSFLYVLVLHLLPSLLRLAPLVILYELGIQVDFLIDSLRRLHIVFGVVENPH